MQKTMNLSKRSFFTAALGTLIEYYDYSLFTIFLPIIAPLFFPSSSPYQSLIKGYFILLISMLARPLGGFVFGYIGDLLGRRQALLTSMYGIAIATLILGLTPSAAHIGFWAAIIIVIAKSVQMFFFGGEYNGAGIYVVEHAQYKNEGFIGGLLTATTLVGGLSAALIGILVTVHGLPSWSWRLAFILGGVVGFMGISARKNLIESPNFKPAEKRHHFRKLVKSAPREFMAGILIGGFATVPFVTVLGFINPVLMAKGYFHQQQLMMIQALLSFIGIMATIISGKLADQIGASKMMQLATLSLVMLSYPLLHLMELNIFSLIIFSEIMFIVINQMLFGPSNCYLKNAFSMPFRYRASSTSFCLGMSLFGGITPLLESILYQWSGHFSGISIWLTFIGLSTFLSLRAVARKTDLRLTA